MVGTLPEDRMKLCCWLFRNIFYPLKIWEMRDNTRTADATSAQWSGAEVYQRSANERWSHAEFMLDSRKLAVRPSWNYPTLSPHLMINSSGSLKLDCRICQQNSPVHRFISVTALRQCRSFWLDCFYRTCGHDKTFHDSTSVSEVIKNC